jgi:putative ABC transport system permease protein
VGRLSADASLPRAEAELAGIASRLAEAYPETNRDTGIRLVPLREQVVRDVRRVLIFLLAAGAVAVGLSRVLTRFVFQVSTLDLAAFTVAPVLLASSVLLATYLPARRATRVDPMRVLRAD